MWSSSTGNSTVERIDSKPDSLAVDQTSSLSQGVEWLSFHRSSCLSPIMSRRMSARTLLATLSSFHRRARCRLPYVLSSARCRVAVRSAVLVVVAGMEGALPSAVGGLVSCPVIAVPTSVGYGASFNGLAALLGMLNSCASNVTVVNIDNGFGAGYVASLINRL